MKEFHLAASKGDIEKLESLIDKQIAEMNGINEVFDVSGRTALHFAVVGGHIKTVEWLISKGANINVVDKQFQLPIFLAAENLDEPMITLLLKHKSKTVVFYKPTEALTVMMPVRKQEDELYLSLKNASDQNLSKKNMLAKKYALCKELSRILKPLAKDEAATWCFTENRHFEAISFQPDGTLRFGSNAELEKLNKHLNATTSIKLLMQDDTEKEVMLSYEGCSAKADVNKQLERTYRLPPLVFYMTHDDEASFKFIMNNFKFLRNLGYKKLCFEFDHNRSLDSFIEQCQVNIEYCQNNNMMENVTEAKNHLLFFQAVKNERWLEYVAVDSILGNLRRPGCSPIVSELNDVREIELAKRISDQADRTHGGIVSIIGVGHKGLQKRLFQTIGACAQDFQFYYCFSKEFKHYYPLSSRFLSFKEHQAIHFNMKVTDFDMSKETKESDEAEKIFRRQVQDVVQTKVPKQEPYQKTLDEDTTLLRALKKYFKLPFKGDVSEEYYVDARYPVKDLVEFI